MQQIALHGPAHFDTGITESAMPGPDPVPAQLPAYGSDTLAALTHDARNLITALGLYCDLLEEPGVLAAPFAHYGNELRLVVAAGRRLVSKLGIARFGDAGLGDSWLGDARLGDARLGTCNDREAAARFWAPAESVFTGSLFPAHELNPLSAAGHAGSLEPQPVCFEEGFPATPIRNLAAELIANRNLLAALAGPGIALTVDTAGGALGVSLTAEDLTRILVNLVKNASEAMPKGGRIRIGLAEKPADSGQPSLPGIAASFPCPRRLELTFEDNGPGISAESIGRVFDPGFTTRGSVGSGDRWSALHRGLGLAITRSIVESVSGSIRVSNRPGGGARFLIELPAI